MTEAAQRQVRLDQSRDVYDAEDGEGSQNGEDRDHCAVKKLGWFGL